MKNYYSILEIEPTDNQVIIKTAYKKLAKKYHPDINKENDNNEKFKEINQAYQYLKENKPIKENIEKYTTNINYYIYKNFESLKNGNLIPEVLKNDLFIHINITIQEAINGTKIKFKHQNGLRSIKIPSNTGIGEIIKFKGLGKLNTQQTGDLYIKIHIKNSFKIKVLPNNHIITKQKICLIDYFFNNKKERGDLLIIAKIDYISVIKNIIYIFTKKIFK
jgi:DnaJ-class molecular chaperone